MVAFEGAPHIERLRSLVNSKSVIVYSCNPAPSARKLTVDHSALLLRCCHFATRVEYAVMTDRLSITFVSRKWPPAMGGLETFSKAVADALAAHADVETIVLAGRADGSTPNIRELLSFGLRTAFRLVFARHPSQVTHVSDMASWPLAFCARIRQPSGRQVISANGTDVSYPLRGGIRGHLYGAYLRLGAMLLGPTTIIANSEATADAARRYGFGDTVVVPLATDVAPQSGGMKGQRLLFSGRLIPLKGFAWFVREVLPCLPEDITLDVAGTVWDQKEAAALQHPRVRFLGRLEQDALFRAYAEALCVVVPNIVLPNGQFEGFGLVAVEAAAAGGVVVASKHGGLKEAVIDGETGFLLPPEDAPTWAEKIRAIAGWSSEHRARFTEHAQKTCVDHFNWNRVATDVIAAYRVGNSGGNTR